MKFEEYLALFEEILSKKENELTPPYTNPSYLEYTKLNWHRMHRWFKTGKLSEQLLSLVQHIKTPQSWDIITEPWCGDAAHSIPFIKMAADTNPLITVSFELRDSPPFRINEFLTNGTKSIPKLIISEPGNEDVATWGPRPKDCQVLYNALKISGAPEEKVKTELQLWYNTNKGVDIQKEIVFILERRMKPVL